MYLPKLYFILFSEIGFLALILLKNELMFDPVALGENSRLEFVYLKNEQGSLLLYGLFLSF